MARHPKLFDVWYHAANTVYRRVPYEVVVDWVVHGRLAADDKLRYAGGTSWKRVGDWELFADYLPRRARVEAVAEAGAPPVVIELPEPADADVRPRRRRSDDDDDVDMIPLIDISMVLLVFFIIVSATGALSPVDVPDMRYAGELRDDPDSITVSIERANAEDVYYSVRVGKAGPKPEHARLPNPEAALTALDARLGETTRPPHVQIACEAALPSERVMELNLELKKRMEKGMINSFAATVNEAPKQ